MLGVSAQKLSATVGKRVKTEEGRKVEMQRWRQTDRKMTLKAGRQRDRRTKIDIYTILDTQIELKMTKGSNFWQRY